MRNTTKAEDSQITTALTQEEKDFQKLVEGFKIKTTSRQFRIPTLHYLATVRYAREIHQCPLSHLVRDFFRDIYFTMENIDNIKTTLGKKK